MSRGANVRWPEKEMEKVLSIINNIMAMVCFSLIYGHWQKSQVHRFFVCCTADSQADKDQNQLNKNLKIELETFPVTALISASQ